MSTFILNCIKGHRIVQTTSLVIVIEMDLPLLKVNIPSGYNNRKINLNEILQLQILPNES